MYKKNKKCFLPTALLLLALIFVLSACDDDTNSYTNSSEASGTAQSGQSGDGLDGLTSDQIENEDAEAYEDAEGAKNNEQPGETSDSAYVPKDHGYGQIATFSTIDLNGASFDKTLFNEKPLTFINYWATWCGPCRSELPDFPGMCEKYKEQVTFVTIVDDGQNNDNAKTLAAQYLNGFINLLPTADLVDPIETGYVPTSVIVDSEGFLVIDKIIGAVGDYSYFIDDALGIIED